jgi:CRP-like cAMP-binding protein
MGGENSLTTTDKLLYLGRLAWSQTRLPGALRRLSIAAEHLRERSFPRGALLAREGEPVTSCYVLARGRVRLSRRGTALGEAGSGALVGFEPLLAQDHLGIGVVAETDVLALQLDSDTLLGILGDHFPLVHEGIRAATRRLLALIQGLPELRDDATGLVFPPPSGRPMNIAEVLLFLRTPGGPFERSSLDALAELAAACTLSPFERGHVFWKAGDRARRIGLVVEGQVACTSARPSGACCWRVGPGRSLGVLEAAAGEPRWFDAVAQTRGLLLEQDVDSLADLYEDNVDLALDYLAWVSRTTLALIERELGPGRELLEFLTTLAATEAPSLSPLERHEGRAYETEGEP